MRISGEKQLNFLSNLLYAIFKMQEPFTTIKEVNHPEIKPCIYAMWHGHQLCVHGINDRSNLNILISRSIDGEIIARIGEKWGFKTVRGSKGKKGSVEATIKLIDKLKKGESIAMMLDGPSGPAFTAKDGVIKIAKMSQIPIIPVYWYSSDITFLKMPSWDGLRCPLGFSRMINLYGEPIYVNADNTEEKDEEVRIQLQASLNELEKRAPEVFKETFKIKLWTDK